MTVRGLSADVDLSVGDTLDALFDSFTFVATGGKRLILAGVEPRVKEPLEATGMTALIGAERVFVTTAVLGEPLAQAFAAAHEWTANAATTDQSRSAEVTS